MPFLVFEDVAADGESLVSEAVVALHDREGAASGRAIDDKLRRLRMALATEQQSSSKGFQPLRRHRWYISCSLSLPPFSCPSLTLFHSLPLISSFISLRLFSKAEDVAIILGPTNPLNLVDPDRIIYEYRDGHHRLPFRSG